MGQSDLQRWLELRKQKCIIRLDCGRHRYGLRSCCFQLSHCSSYSEVPLLKLYKKPYWWFSYSCHLWHQLLRLSNCWFLEYLLYEKGRKTERSYFEVRRRRRSWSFTNRCKRSCPINSLFKVHPCIPNHGCSWNLHVLAR